MPSGKHILITDESHELPYSKGLTATSIMATGLTPGRAYDVAETIEDELVASGVESISMAELDRMIEEIIRRDVDDHIADNFVIWQAVEELDRPIVIVIGGATGVGKSTVASQLAARLGITRVIPTDAIREVMRGMLTPDLMPSLHVSSFAAESLITQPLPKSADRLIIGFREQVQAVAVGVNSLISRAIAEGTDLIVEGAHACPGFVDDPEPKEAVFVPIVIAIDDEEIHRSHFGFRALEERSRPPERYLKYFDNIRRIQKYVRKAAKNLDVPVVESFDLDATIAECIDIVLDKVAESVG